MPLHLLGKKSWNVYNAASIERVRRDEAEAKAREEAAEQRMQEEDAQRRIGLLRGEDVPALPQSETFEGNEREEEPSRSETYSQRDRKRRRLRGEDDTDRDIRYAKLDSSKDKSSQSLIRGKERDAPLQDHAGNISLIPAPDELSVRKTKKNAEVEVERATQRRREEDQYTLRFSNAGGFGQNMQQNPWYTSSTSTIPSTTNALEKDVWGNEDPRRREREQSRISSNDPFAAMQQAQKQLKQSERDKEAWAKKQKPELEELKKQERHDRERRRKNCYDDDVDSLDGFSLDPPPEQSDHDRRRKHRHRHHHHHHHHHRRHKHRSRSRSPSPGRHRDRDKHRHRRHDGD